MKTLLILRHAKSSWKHQELADYDRPLNDRGKRDAPRMGRLMAEEAIVPDMILTSTAQRARRTAMHVTEACDYEGSLMLRDELYLAGPPTIVGILNELPDTCGSAAVVAHNPGLEDLLDLLTGESEALPTAALAVVELPIDRWAELDLETEGRLVSLWRPRELEAEV